MPLWTPAKCSEAPYSTPSDAGVAGAGIILSFIITAGIAVLLSGSVIYAELRGKQSSIRRKLLNGYSDSQILQGIGIQCVGLAKMNTLVPYHFFIIWMLSLLSMATHNATLLALVNDYRRDWVIRWLRQCLMFINMALSCVLGVFVLQAVTMGIENDTLPIACAWRVDARNTDSTIGLSYVGTIVVIAGNGLIFTLATWYLHNRNQRFYKAIQTIGVLFMAMIGTGAAIRVVLLSQAFGKPSVELSDQGETVWSYGQLLSMLVLLYPLVTVIEMARGEIMVAANDDQGGPYTEELSNTSKTRLIGGKSKPVKPMRPVISPPMKVVRYGDLDL
jgi:hypothetical protein